MNFKKAVRITTAVTAAFTAALFIVIGYISYSLPDYFYHNSSDSFEVGTIGLHVEAGAKVYGEELLVNSNTRSEAVHQIKLFHIIPIKEVYVKQTKEVNLIPVGKPFGIKMLSKGVIVNGLSSITTQSGEKQPAQKAGIQVGDIVISINGKQVLNNTEVSQVVKESKGDSLKVKATRNGKEISFTVEPVKSSDDGQFKIGMWVRDSTAGIGTMTFLDPDTGTFAGLGHGISDVDTGEIVPLASGEIVDVNLTGIDKSREGEPGQLKGNFKNDEPLGTLEKNTDIGIYGHLNEPFTDVSNFYPMGYKQEIKKGEATIITTVEGKEPQEYAIRIDKVSLNNSQGQKNMVIEVTDERLLNQTGGIVQGMSGSPIIQDGKIVGAVTHVFVNNPKKGYGIFCENMFDIAKMLN